jgi:uncharacterized protein YqcC (DUF446 family)
VPHHAAYVSELLRRMELEMQRLALWEATPPPPRALASPMPFCYDTLRFEQWLQWVFLPRMRQIVEQGAPLPPRSDIAPMAELAFEGRQQETVRLVALLREFDHLIHEDGGRFM